MKELKLDAEHMLTEEEIGEMTGIPMAQVRGFYPLHHMAFADGSLAIRARVYFAEDAPERDRSEVHIEIGDGAIRGLDLSSHATRREKQPYAENDWASIPIGNDVLYLQGTSHAFLLSRGREASIHEIRIEHGISDARINEEVSARLRPNRNARPVSDGNAAAISLSDGSLPKYLAVLTLDREKLQARWSRFVPQNGGGSFLARLFRQNPAQSTLAAGDLPQLSVNDFPKLAPAFDSPPLVNEALLRNGRVYIYTKGHSETPKAGHDCSDIAEIGPDGRVLSRPFGQDYRKVDDEKKRGLAGRFTTSGRYCVLRSIYQSTDPWKGRERLFDMDTGELVDVSFPRGYTKFRITDHAGAYFWAVFEEKDAPYRFARFRTV